MDVFEAVMKRRSTRAFKKDAIPEGVVQKLKEAVRWAPTAGHLESRFFYFVLNAEKRKAVAASYFIPDSFVGQAPLIVVACTDSTVKERYGERGETLYTTIDVAASVENLMLAAVEAGLGTCWVGKFDEEAVRKALNIPEGLRPISLVPVGVPAEQKQGTRKDEKETIQVIS
ncbi:MAG: nitroreductase family protein [Candidatus Micrarchaeota archaeon]